MSITLDYSDKKVVVIGGTSGINRGIAECFAQQGACVAVASRSQEKVDDTVVSLQSCGATQAMGFSADVRDIDTLKAGLQSIADAWGEFDVLISGAAGNFPAMATGMSAKGFRSVVDIDLLGTFHVMQSAFPHLKKPGASIVNISAPQALLPMQAQSHVCAAKAGVDMITRCLALEWGSEGIRINSIIPGPIDGTEGMKRLAPTPELLEMSRESVPLKRLGLPEDIAQACLFLSSPLAGYITGVVLPVDGGWAQGGAASMGQTLAELLRQAPQTS